MPTCFGALTVFPAGELSFVNLGAESTDPTAPKSRSGTKGRASPHDEHPWPSDRRNCRVPVNSLPHVPAPRRSGIPWFGQQFAWERKSVALTGQRNIRERASACTPGNGGKEMRP